jgi:hypothetical protein
LKAAPRAHGAVAGHRRQQFVAVRGHQLRDAVFAQLGEQRAGELVGSAACSSAGTPRTASCVGPIGARSKPRSRRASACLLGSGDFERVGGKDGRE